MKFETGRVSLQTRVTLTNPSRSQSYLLSSRNLSAHTHGSSSLRLFLLQLQFLVPLHHHHHPGGSAGTLARNKSAMARVVVVEGMPETAVGGGVMLNRRKSKARRRKRKELFAFQMCFAGLLLGLVVGFRSVAQKAGEGRFETALCFTVNRQTSPAFMFV